MIPTNYSPVKVLDSTDNMDSVASDSSVVIRAERIYLKPNENLERLCHLSKNLYNEGNYLVRQKFFETGEWIRYYDMWQCLKDSENYHGLPGQTAQQTLRVLDKNWKSFFQAMKAWKNDPSKFYESPGLPRYKKKDGLHTLFFTNQQVKIKNGLLVFPKKIGLEVKTRLPGSTKLNGARIVPLGIGYRLEILYEKEIPKLRTDEPERIVGIDLGLNNLITMTNNIGEEPIIIKGGPVKSMNQYYNKKKAKLQSVYDHQGQKVSKRTKRMSIKRSNKMSDYFHKSSRMVINWCIERDIDTIVIGRNKHWKQRSKLGKKTNQNFVMAPLYLLPQQIAYKAEEVGIRVIEQEEGHTSKCSFLDGESIEHHEEYMGRRVHRGMFKASDGRLINADVNGGYNIMVKAIPEAFVDGIEGVGFHPKRSKIE